ncbi:MAG: lipase family protein [Bacteroidales bacterium]|nr:lipase family protein [Bacteroidales bacterium]
MKKFLLLSIFISIVVFGNAQNISPGFSYNEYIEMLHISAYQVDTPWSTVKIEYPKGYTMAYRSDEIALLNRWDLWISADSTVVISIRGTTNNFNSWLENFYAAMVPASGKMQISESKEYNYHLSDDPKAGVHVGWLLALAYMEPGISQKIDSCINKGYRNFYITGHSQGGAIASLLTANIWLKKEKGLYSPNVNFKTYCSAAPKPGNINFARQYSYLTQKGYAFNVINALDWVPEMPFTVQTLNDINELNPISADKNTLNKLGVLQKVYVGSSFRKVDKSLKKSVRLFRKYLGKKAYKLVNKSLVELIEPNYLENNYYVSAGEIIILYPDSTYHEKFSKNPKHTFVHHMLTPYLYLANKQNNE